MANINNVNHVIQVPHQRAVAFYMASIMERGEPDEDEEPKYLVRVTAMDGGPLVLCLSMATTIGDLNQRLADEYGVNVIYLGQVDDQGQVADVGAWWRPLDLYTLEVRMGLAVRHPLED